MMKNKIVLGLIGLILVVGAFSLAAGLECRQIPAYVFTSQQAGTVAMYRVFNPTSGDHGLTINNGSPLSLRSDSAGVQWVLDANGNDIGYKYEGILGYVYPVSGGTSAGGASGTGGTAAGNVYSPAAGQKIRMKNVLDGYTCYGCVNGGVCYGVGSIGFPATTAYYCPVSCVNGAVNCNLVEKKDNGASCSKGYECKSDRCSLTWEFWLGRICVKGGTQGLNGR